MTDTSCANLATQGNLTTTPGQPLPPMDYTAGAALSPGKLLQKSREISDATTKRMLLEALESKKVGTYPIECQALKLSEENGGASRALPNASGKSKLERILAYRDPDKVEDVLKLKVKYARAKEEELRNEYKKIKKQLEEAHRKAGRNRKF